jgi:hypothetical protein
MHIRPDRPFPAISFALIGVVLLLASGCSRTPGNSDIKRIAKDFIKKQILTPSTAKFPSSDDIMVKREKGDSTFYVSSYVDAQNAFGAMIRNEWRIHIWYIGGPFSDPESWKILHE